ncbi:hypothetical protein H8959_001107 [Pygathrix nigripes]
MDTCSVFIQAVLVIKVYLLIFNKKSEISLGWKNQISLDIWLEKNRSSMDFTNQKFVKTQCNTNPFYFKSLVEAKRSAASLFISAVGQQMPQP